jgi:hypothetical protein
VVGDVVVAELCHDVGEPLVARRTPTRGNKAQRATQGSPRRRPGPGAAAARDRARRRTPWARREGRINTGHGRSDQARTEVSNAGSVAWMLDVLESMPRAAPDPTPTHSISPRRRAACASPPPDSPRRGGIGERGWIPRIYRASTLRQIDLGSSHG